MDVALPSFVLGYHGCDAALAEAVIAGRDVLRPSRNAYDWLGDGIYFWEHNAARAFEFASEVAARPNPSGQRIDAPAVVGAVIDLTRCLNLLDTTHLRLVADSFRILREAADDTGAALPRNTVGPDLLRRQLDCRVIESLHRRREQEGDAPFESVRAVFPEGAPLYEGAGFRAKNHLQIAVRSPARILGYFRPLDADGTPRSFA